VVKTTLSRRVEYVKVTENGKVEERLTIDEEQYTIDLSPTDVASGDETDSRDSGARHTRKIWDFVKDFLFA
jgi:hypothetical protein